MKKDKVKTGLLFVMLVVIIYTIIMIVLPFTGIKIGSICGDLMSGSCISESSFIFGLSSVPVILFTVVGYEVKSPIVSLIGCAGFLIYNIYVSFMTSYIELIRFTYINALLFLLLVIINLYLLKFDKKKDLNKVETNSKI